MVKIMANGRIRMFFFQNGPSSPSLCNYSTLLLIQLLSSMKRLFLIKFTSSSMDFWSFDLPWYEPQAIIIDSAVNRLESNGFRDQLWNKKHSGNKQTSGREKLTQTMISRSGNLQNPITRRPLPNQLSAPSSLIVCSKFSLRYKGRVRLPNRMNFRKNSKRPSSPHPSFPENYTASFFFRKPLKKALYKGPYSAI